MYVQVHELVCAEGRKGSQTSRTITLRQDLSGNRELIMWLARFRYAGILGRYGPNRLFTWVLSDPNWSSYLYSEHPTQRVITLAPGVVYLLFEDIGVTRGWDTTP